MTRKPAAESCSWLFL